MSNKTYALGQGDKPLSYSEDRGLTWQWIDVTIPERPRQVISRPFNPDEVFVTVNPTIGGVSGLYYSSDGGTTFSPVTLPASIVGITKMQFVDNNSIVAIAYQNLTPGPADFFFIYSNDGGSTFTVGDSINNFVPTNYEIPVSGPGDPFYLRDIYIYFNNFSEGYIALNIVETADPTHQKIIIWKTTENGQAWPTSIQIDNAFLLAMVASNDVQKVLLYLNDNTDLNNNADVYRLDDDLLSSPTFIAHWGINSAYDLTGGFNIFTQVEYYPSLVFALDKSPANTSSILYSEDFGLTWTLVNDTLPQEYQGVPIIAYDPDTLIVQASSATYNIARSEDGGLTFVDVFDAPANTGNSRSMDTTENFGCGECPPTFTINENSNRCEQYTLGGPLCNPPNFLFGPTGDCALASTIQPSNILYAIDNSSSVSTNQDGVNERELFRDFINILTDKLSARLSINSIKVGVVHWSTEACYDQSFTSDKALINSSVERILSCPTCPGVVCSGTTNHGAALCESLTALHAQALANPSAENVLILFTDGTNNTAFDCDLTGIGLAPIVNTTSSPTFPQSFFDLLTDAKANLAGKGLKIMVCVVGSNDERSQVKQYLLDGPLANGQDPYPSYNAQDDYYYYFDAGDFTEADFIAQQLILGLGAQITPSGYDCPPECEAIPGPDNLGYCRCLNIAPLEQCQYRLIDCLGVQAPVITDADLQTYYDAANIITIIGSDTCWEIEKLDQNQPNPQQIVVDEVFAECLECLPSSKLFNCADITNIIYSSTDLSAYTGKTIQLQEYPGECWQVGPNDDLVYVPEPLTIEGQPYDTCEECNPTKYQLTNCLNGDSFIITDSELSAYTGRAIRAVNVPGLCFFVTSPPACLCIEVSINGTIYEVTASPDLWEGKNLYLFQTTALDNLGIAWNIEENYWDFFNQDTLETYAYNTLDTPCPFGSNWTIEEGSPFIINYVTYCYDEIYDIDVEQDFVSCEACINC